MVKAKLIDWKWIKKNFWNVVLVMILWQLVVFVIFSLLSLAIPIPGI